MRDLNAPGRVTSGRIQICSFRGLSLKVRIARYLLEAENSQNRYPVRNRQSEAVAGSPLAEDERYLLEAENSLRN